MADAIWIAGQIVVKASQARRLLKDYYLYWLGASANGEQRVELMRRFMDPAVRFSVPVLGIFISESSVIVIRRSMGTGYAGIDNELYTGPKTSMYFADAKTALADLTAAIKMLMA